MKKWYPRILAMLLLVIIHQQLSAQCTGCTTTISTNSSASYTVNSGQQLCITATGSLTGNLVMNGGIVCNQGTVNPALFTFNGGVFHNYGQFIYNGYATVKNGAKFYNNTNASLKISCAFYAELNGAYLSEPSADLIVSPVNSLAILAGSSLSICSGQNVSLSALGANVYTWQPSSGLNVTTGATVIASPTVTTTYTVIGTASGCGGGSKTVTVTVGSPPAITFTVQTESTVPVIQWSKVLGGSSLDRVYGISPTSDGGFIVCGMAQSSDGDVTGNHGFHDFWVIKLSSSGNVDWKTALGGTNVESAWSVQQTSDGGYIVGGIAYSSDGQVTGQHGGSDFWLTKLNSSGVLQWQKTYGGTGSDEMEEVKQTSDGGYILTGFTTSTNGDVTGNHGGNGDYWVIKVNSTGTLQWQKCLGGSGQDKAHDVIQTSDGGFLVAGQTSSADGDVTGFYGNIDYWIVKLTSTGTLNWQKTFGGTSVEIANAIVALPGGNYMITGRSAGVNGDVWENYGGNDVWAIKIDGNGNLLWQDAFGGSGNEIGKSLVLQADGSCVIGGYTSSQDEGISTQGGNDAFLLKINSNGDKVWNYQYGGSAEEVITNVCNSADGGYGFVAYTQSNNGDVSGNHGNEDFWVVKAKELMALPVSYPHTFQLIGPVASSYTWKVNNVTVGSSPSLAYTFSVVGTYSVSLNVTYSCGQSSYEQIISVVDKNKLANKNMQVDYTYTDATAAAPSGGSLQVAAIGGYGPFTYAWSTGANTPVINSLSPGRYTVTITDRYGFNVAQQVSVGNKINWNTPAGEITTESSGKTLIKTAASAWCGIGATSSNHSQGSNINAYPWMQYKVTQLNVSYLVGYTASTSNSTQSPNYKLLVDNNMVYALEIDNDGFYKKTSLGNALLGDIWSIDFFDGTIQYKRNFVTKYTSPIIPIVPLKLEGDIYNNGGKIAQVQSNLGF